MRPVNLSECLSVNYVLPWLENYGEGEYYVAAVVVVVVTGVVEYVQSVRVTRENAADGEVYYGCDCGFDVRALDYDARDAYSSRLEK